MCQKVLSTIQDLTCFIWLEPYEELTIILLILQTVKLMPREVSLSKVTWLVSVRVWIKEQSFLPHWVVGHEESSDPGIRIRISINRVILKSQCRECTSHHFLVLKEYRKDRSSCVGQRNPLLFLRQESWNLLSWYLDSWSVYACYLASDCFLLAMKGNHL